MHAILDCLQKILDTCKIEAFNFALADCESDMKYIFALLSSSSMEDAGGVGGTGLILWEELHLLEKFLTLNFSDSH